MENIETVKDRWNSMAKQYADESEVQYLPSATMLYILGNWEMIILKAFNA